MSTDVKPYDCDFKQYEARLSTRDFWDDCGHSSTKEAVIAKEQLFKRKFGTIANGLNNN